MGANEAAARRRTGWRRSALAAAVMALALASCEGRGIYYTLATEAPRANRDLNDELTVVGVVAAGGHYYAAAGGLWRRASGGENWRPVGRPQAGGAELRVLGLAAAGGTLCAGTERGLYYAGAAERPGWKSATGAAGEQVLRVFAVPYSPDGTLLAITAVKLGEEQHEYRVHASTDGCRTFRPVEGVAGRPSDAAYAFGAYWITAGDKLYRGATLDTLAEHAPQPAASGAYRGVFFNDAKNRLYVAAAEEFVYFTADPGTAGGAAEGAGAEDGAAADAEADASQTWSRVRVAPPAGVSDNVKLTMFTQVGGVILIGARDFGFYQFSDGRTADAERGPRLTSQLYTAHVTGFARAGTGDDRIVFAATAGDGLSSINVKSAGGRLGTWDRE